MKVVGQYKLVSCEKTKNGTKITLRDYDNNEISGIYNLGNLNFEQIQKLIGHKISCTREDGEFSLHKAWDGQTPTFCDDISHGFDR